MPRRNRSSPENNVNLNLTYEKTLGTVGGIRAEASLEADLGDTLGLKANRLNGSFDAGDRTASINAGLGSKAAKSGASVEGTIKLGEDGRIEAIGGGVSGRERCDQHRQTRPMDCPTTKPDRPGSTTLWRPTHRVVARATHAPLSGLAAALALVSGPTGAPAQPTTAKLEPHPSALHLAAKRLPHAAGHDGRRWLSSQRGHLQAVGRQRGAGDPGPSPPNR